MQRSNTDNIYIHILNVHVIHANIYQTYESCQ